MRESKTAVFTIASVNYFAQVKTLMDSLKESNPDWDRQFALVDDLIPEIQEACEGIRIWEMKDLDIPDLDDMKFRYDVMELNTAIKPFVFLRLFKEYDRVVYIDPDICVYEKMQAVNQAFDDGYEFVVTPHFTGYWKQDGKHPDEPDIMRAGIYNFGFFAAANCNDAQKVIGWWADKLRTLCINRQAEGIFVDQKWMDLLPARHDKVYILRDNGYNTAYWNLQHRDCTCRDGKYYFNGDPLVFFHFSGFNPEKPDSISKHQNRLSMTDIGPAQELFRAYAKNCMDNHYADWRKYKYSYQKFTDGRDVKDIFRYLYRDMDEVFKMVGGRNPFACSDIFYDNKEKIAGAMVNYACKTHPEVGSYFLNTNRSQWLDWFRDVLIHQYKLDDEWVEYMMSFLAGHLNQFEGGGIKLPMMHPVTPRLKDGVNLIGYIKSEHGLGEACRLTADALSRTGLDWAAYDWEMNNPSRQTDATWDAKLDDKIRYNISIFNINADQMGVAKEHLPAEAWQGYRIGIWYWELTKFPRQWRSAFDLVDEIWAPTRFIQENLQKVAPCPVFYMPPGLSREEPDAAYDRKYFGLPEDTFLFLNMFDAYSYTSRKNPAAVIDAFQMAFQPDDMSVGLVLKVNNMSKKDEDYIKLTKVLKGYKNIHIIPKTMSRAEVNGLINVCDVSVSLHRSEGLGLLCEESMYFGKPVIATNWSGNTDFMTEDSACMVDYTMIPIGEYYGTNEPDQQWADAKVEHASEYMLRLRNDREYYQRVSDNARKYIHEQFSPEVCGRRMEERIKEILSDPQKLKKHAAEAVAPQAAPQSAPAAAAYPDSQTLDQDIYLINSYWAVDYNTVPLGAAGGLKFFIKRVIRKLLRFLIAPLVNMQRDYNAASTRVMNELLKRTEAERTTNAMLVQESVELKNELGRLKVEKEELVQQLEILQSAWKESNAGDQADDLREMVDELREEIRKGQDNTHQDLEQVKSEQTHVLQQTGSWYNALFNIYMQLNHQFQQDNTAGAPIAFGKEVNTNKWKLIDKYYKEPARMRCCICDEEIDTTKADRLSSEDIFGGGILLRYRCPKCGAIVGPNKMLELSEEELGEEYKLHYEVNVESPSPDSEIETFMQLHPDKDKVYLNYGCGGWNAAIDTLRRQGYNVYGFDPYAPNSSEYIISDYDELLKHQYDGIFSHDLLEHLRYPVKIFELFAQILKPDGKMVHSTACYKYVYEYDRFHLVFYTGNAVDELCRKTGFAVRERIEDNDRLMYSCVFERE